MLKIAVNATILDDKPSGLGIYALNVTHELSKFLELSVITSHSESFEGNPKIRIIKAPEILQPAKRKVGAVTRLLWLNLVLPRILKKEKIDLLINLTHHGLFFSPIPQILTIHDLIPLRFPSQYKFQNCYYRLLLPSLVGKSVAVNTPTQFMKREIITAYRVEPQKVLVSGNSYNTFLRRSELHRGKDSNYILMVGASFRHKNFDRVLEAYSTSRILQENRLIIAGGAVDYLTHLKTLSKELQIQDKVELIDYAEPEHLSELYSNAIVFVYPSLYEGFGMPPLEAMRLGTAVAASRIDAVQEVCGSAAFYFDPSAVKDIREKLEQIAENEELRDELVKKGFEQVRKHTWYNVARKIHDFILESSEITGIVFRIDREREPVP